MSITRRGLLQGIFAATLAPAIVKAEILMPVRKIIVPQANVLTLDALRRAKEKMEEHAVPPLRGDIGSLYGISIISMDYIQDAQQEINDATRKLLGDRPFVVVHPSMFEALMRGCI